MGPPGQAAGSHRSLFPIPAACLPHPAHPRVYTEPMDITADTPLDELATTHAALRRAWQARRPDHAQRRADLLRLREAFRAGLPAMDAAIRGDFGHRSEHENLLSEAMIVLAELDHALGQLRRWMRPRRAAVGWRFWPARAQVRP